MKDIYMFIGVASMIGFIGGVLLHDVYITLTCGIVALFCNQEAK